MEPTDTSIAEEYFLLELDLELSEDSLLWLKKITFAVQNNCHWNEYRLSDF